jgi:2,3-bisphosphoglycerate-independent phosphoglycerate mutase
MMEYDGDLNLPRRYLVSPPQIAGTMGERLAATGVPSSRSPRPRSTATSRTSGTATGAACSTPHRDLRRDPVGQVPFEQRPWMKAAEITDRLIAELRTGRHASPGSTTPTATWSGTPAHFDATVMAVEAVDLQLARLLARGDRAGRRAGGHRRSRQRRRDVPARQGRRDRRDPATGVPVAKTSHTLAPVPFAIHDPTGGDHYALARARAGAGIASVTATCLELLGYTAPTDLAPSLVRFS